MMLLGSPFWNILKRENHEGIAETFRTMRQRDASPVFASDVIGWL